MSTYVVAARERRSLAPVVAITAGFLLLLLRAQAMSAGAGRIAVLVGLYVALAAVSLRMPVPATHAPHISPRTAAVVGVVAVTAIAFAPWNVGVSPTYGVVAAALGVLAAIAEEAFFRRLVYGWAERWWGAGVAVIVSALAFALVHVPLYGVTVLWLDLGAGLLLAWQRWASGSWGAPAATHAAANLLVALR